MKKCFTIVFVVFCLLFAQSDATELHAILVGDTLNNDIGASVRTDLNNMRQEIEKISKYTGLNLNIHEFSDNACIPENVLQELQFLDVESDDVVVFYFSGHGYRVQSKNGNPWPNLFFMVQYQGIDLDEIHTILKEKNSRLILSIADCCNNFIPEMHAPPLIARRALIAKMSGDKIRKNYKKLFLEEKGSILIASAREGEYSWCSSLGGLYTNAWRDSLLLETTYTLNPSWKNLLDRAAKNPNLVQNKQNPEYIIEKK